MSPSNLLTEWARLLLGSLRRAGISDVVISPGSRSTPFAWAALQEPGLRCRTVIDERSAAFFAVGHARLTGRPALLVCTSGSAAANYFPALVEASEARIPVMVLSADRPLELQHAAAPQTVDQVALYGDHARAYFELGLPDADPRSLRSVPRLAVQAVATARGPDAGPVHLNARARKPLDPRPPSDLAGRALSDTVDALLERVPVAVSTRTRIAAEALHPVVEACRAARRGLIVCGPALPGDAARPDALERLANATGFPVVAEAASQLRFGGPADVQRLDAFPALLDVEGFADRHTPDLLIQVGRPPTASAWHRALHRWQAVDRCVIEPHGWADPWSTARWLLRAPLDPTVRALASALSPEVGSDRAGHAPDPSKAPPGEAHHGLDQDWATTLVEVDRRARALIEASLEDGFSEGAAVRTVVDRLPPDAVLALGNSLPIREVDLFAPGGRKTTDGEEDPAGEADPVGEAEPGDAAEQGDAAEPGGKADRGGDLPVDEGPRGRQAPRTVWFQRGANGIDGLIAGAAGAAAASGRPTTLLIGDVSFVHDLGSLRVARDLPAPLTIVVLDNGGGRIFDRLPMADTLDGRPERETWLTPPGCDFEAAARTFGLRHARATDVPSLEVALEALRATGGVLEVAVPEGGTTDHQRSLRERLDHELGA